MGDETFTSTFANLKIIKKKNQNQIRQSQFTLDTFYFYILFSIYFEYNFIMNY
jgi:hypothetical protein